MKTAQSRSTAHHMEEQEMSMIVRVTCCNDGDHQKHVALAMLTLLGAGRVEAARELKPPQGPTGRGESKRSDAGRKGVRP